MARDKPASAAPKLPDNVLRKLVTAEQAVADIRPGEHVFVGTACATPRSLVAALEQRRPAPADVDLLSFPYQRRDPDRRRYGQHQLSPLRVLRRQRQPARGGAGQGRLRSDLDRPGPRTPAEPPDRDRHGAHPGLATRSLRLCQPRRLGRHRARRGRQCGAGSSPRSTRTCPAPWARPSCTSTASTGSSGRTCRSSSMRTSPPTRSAGRSPAISPASSATAPRCRSASAAFPARRCGTSRTGATSASTPT